MSDHAATLTARKAGLVSCRDCGLLAPMGQGACRRCAAPLHSRTPRSLQRVWAWLFAGMILYIPANLWPMLVTRTLGYERRSTIVGGVVELAQHGAYAIAAIVGVASVLVPVIKFLVIGYLALSVSRNWRMSAHSRTHLYEIIEFIGRWSMIDVFVVAILAALVRLGFVATIDPGPAAVCFALSVAFTMLAAQSFDPRLIWDAADQPEGGACERPD